jgi:hypothetical protein
MSWWLKHITSYYNKDTKETVYVGWDETGSDSVCASSDYDKVVKALQEYAGHFDRGYEKWGVSE